MLNGGKSKRLKNRTAGIQRVKGADQVAFTMSV
jgi:hypothetical protein